MSGLAHEPLRGRTVVVGVAGGIAAYKSAILIRELVTAGASVHAIMTRSAREFVGAITLQALTGRPVFTDLFDLGQEASIGHIEIADAADLLIIAPATASTMARLSAGLADDALSAVALATRAPLLLAPSMNVNMWENPITQRNLRALVDERGAHTVGPGSGFLACEWIGTGRMAEPSDIGFAAAALLSASDLRGRRLVITAGPTRESLDPVRFLGNRSTGRMGTALATAGLWRGAEVTVIAGPWIEGMPSGARRVPVESAEEMHAAAMAEADRADAMVLSAAVADYRPAERRDAKLKKAEWGESPSLRLERTPDILADLGSRRETAGSGPRVLVGFAAETGDPVDAARDKLERKRCDLVVANDVSRSDIGFGSDDNQVTLVDRRGSEDLEKMSKLAVAHRICDWIAAALQEGS